MHVDFMIIGAQKCGTTSLASQLAQHADVCFSRVKEPGYFNRVEEWEIELRSYHKLFSPEDGKICGEASTMYTFIPEWQGTHARLFSYNPDLKLIYIMRNPVNRIISNYAHDLVRGIVKDPPEHVIHRNPAYINRSRYWMQIKPYLELFPKNQVMLLIFEEYIADQKSILHQVASFLKISPIGFDAKSDVMEHKTIGNWYLEYELVRKFTDTKAFQVIRPLVPTKIRKSLRRRLSGRLEKKPRFSHNLIGSIWTSVEDDIQQIEQFMGRRLIYWQQELAL